MEFLKKKISNDLTKKYYFATNTRHVESCLLYLERYGFIICVSSQLGCNNCCKFCAAGNKRFYRNLTVEEIMFQVDYIIDDNMLNDQRFQVTFMGAGEPFENVDSVFSAIDLLREKYKNLTKINISTIWSQKFENICHEIDWNKYRNFMHLQYSLHSSNDILRSKLIGATTSKIDTAIKSLNTISAMLNDTYRINYMLIDSINDDLENIVELEQILSKAQNSVLKISEMCRVNNIILKPSKKFNLFIGMLSERNIPFEVFRSNGTDVNAGCGQFYNDSIV